MCWRSSYQMDRLQLFVLLLWMPNCLLCGISSSPHYSVVGLLLKILKLGMYFYSGCTWAELAFSTLRFSSKFDVFQIKLCWCQYQIEAPTFIGLRLASTLHIRCRYSLWKFSFQFQIDLINFPLMEQILILVDAMGCTRGVPGPSLLFQLWDFLPIWCVSDKTLLMPIPNCFLVLWLRSLAWIEPISKNPDFLKKRSAH
jgi:hypothetical protein